MSQLLHSAVAGTPKISQLFVYPIKSCAGVSVPSLQFDEKGPLFDRRWMLVDSQSGVFLSQRELPKMALISTQINGQEVTAHQSMDSGLTERFVLPRTGDLLDVSVWSDEVQGLDCGDAAANWFTGLLSHECRLVYQGRCVRNADEKYALPGTEVSYADGFPLLVVNQSSIEFLNEECADGEITAVNFRPNIVVENTEVFSEKAWREISTKGVSMKVVKPCERCVIPTLNPETAVSEKGILSTLVKHCRVSKKIYFGQNLTFEYHKGLSLVLGQALVID